MGLAIGAQYKRVKNRVTHTLRGLEVVPRCHPSVRLIGQRWASGTVVADTSCPSRTTRSG
jgi:hypothetical protein